jgi:hypothetical protein
MTPSTTSPRHRRLTPPPRLTLPLLMLCLAQSGLLVVAFAAGLATLDLIRADLPAARASGAVALLAVAGIAALLPSTIRQNRASAAARTAYYRERYGAATRLQVYGAALRENGWRLPVAVVLVGLWQVLR